MALALLMLAWPLAPRTLTGDDDAAKNAAQARKALDAMVQALGGQAWLNMKNQVREGTLPRSSTAFRHRNDRVLRIPSMPDHDRVS